MIVVTHRSSGKPAAVFTSVKAMRTWLRAKGTGAGHFYFQHVDVPLDPTH